MASNLASHARSGVEQIGNVLQQANVNEHVILA
jgi:hypothetical protein